MTRYAIGLGSNLGDRLRHMVDAHDELAGVFEVLAVSPIYETMPIGGPAQDPFLNAVVTIETRHRPLQVLAVCQDIEQRHGRERTQRWGPRTLDVDIVAAEVDHDDDRLTIPHPRAAEREFVLRPLCDVWPDAPIDDDTTARQALDRLDPQGVDRLESRWLPPGSRRQAMLLVAGQLAILIAIALALVYDGSLPDGRATVVRVPGVILASIGAVLLLSAARHLGVATASPIPQAGSRLVTSGPYRLSRHPIYGGLILFMLGATLVFASLLGSLLALGLALYLWLKTGFEERQLRLHFPGYSAYQEKVRRRLIPFIA